jgi:Domain of unknown function (DUF4149)
MYNVPAWLAALWWGSLSAVCFWVVPLLFWHLPSPAIAGAAASKLFSAQTWVALVCGLILIFVESRRLRQSSLPGGMTFFPWVIAAMLAASIAEFAIAPRIVAKDNLRLWHTLGSALYLLQWLCASVTLHRTLQRPAGAQV